MAIIASAIFGRSAFTFGRIRIIRFICSEERCPLNMIYKHALGRERLFVLLRNRGRLRTIDSTVAGLVPL
jgi:hypothetical protein